MSRAHCSAGPASTWLALSLLAAVFAGCDNSHPEKNAADDHPSKTTKSTPKTTDSKAKSVTVDAIGRKWIGDIPYDVFFEDPLALVSDSAKVATPAPTVTTPLDDSSSPTTAPSTLSGPPASNDASDWKSYISMEQLQSETKRIRNHLKSALQTAGTFTGQHKELQYDGAQLAAIANIVAQFPEDVSWKPRARFIRDYGLELSQSSTGPGKAPYEKSQTIAEKIQSVLDGNSGDGDPALQRPFGEVAARTGVMKRMEKAYEWMRTTISTEAKLKSEQDQALNESTMLATMGKVVTDPSYASADEDDYLRQAKNLIEGAKAANAAAQNQDLSKFKEALNKIDKACKDCHVNYGNG